MPQVTVYVRNEDLAKWKALEKKSEFIHNALNPPEGLGYAKLLNSTKVDNVGKFLKNIDSKPGNAPKKLDLNKMADEVLTKYWCMMQRKSRL